MIEIKLLVTSWLVLQHVLVLNPQMSCTKWYLSKKVWNHLSSSRTCTQCDPTRAAEKVGSYSMSTSSGSDTPSTISTTAPTDGSCSIEPNRAPRNNQTVDLLITRWVGVTWVRACMVCSGCWVLEWMSSFRRVPTSLSHYAIDGIKSESPIRARNQLFVACVGNETPRRCLCRRLVLYRWHEAEGCHASKTLISSGLCATIRYKARAATHVTSSDKHSTSWIIYDPVCEYLSNFIVLNCDHLYN